MSLEGIWPVHEDGRQVGTCTVARQGLYLRFDCRCGPADGRILRLVLRSAGGDVSLGIPAPEEGILQLRKGIPAKRLPQVDEFRLELLDLSAEMDLTGNPPVFQINKKRRICNDIASKSNFHALLYDISDLRILFRQIIQGIEGEMHRLFIFFHHLGKDLQLTVCSKLNIAAENLPAI